MLDDGRKVTTALVAALLDDELAKTPVIVGEAAFAAGRYREGASLLKEISTSEEYVEFLTLPAYARL